MKVNQYYQFGMFFYYQNILTLSCRFDHFLLDESAMRFDMGTRFC
jgi:hypothetical protein